MLLFPSSAAHLAGDGPADYVGQSAAVRIGLSDDHELSRWQTNKPGSVGADFTGAHRITVGKNIFVRVRGNAPVGIGKRIAVTGHDLVGMAPTLLPLIAIGLLIAFLVTGLLCRWVPNARFGLYVLAGAIAVLGVHFSLYQVFDITLVAVARTTGGLVTQAAAGALGGYVFVRLSGRTTTAEA